jgi:hypothetical protein
VEPILPAPMTRIECIPNLPVIGAEKGKALQDAIDKLTESRVVFGEMPT